MVESSEKWSTMSAAPSKVYCSSPGRVILILKEGSWGIHSLWLFLSTRSVEQFFSLMCTCGKLFRCR